jgi:RNA polymerase sigma-70 factor, ECF subfamily
MPSLSSDDFMERFVAAQAQVYGYIATLLPNRADADDLFQQTSMVLWRKRESYDPSRDFRSWALGIAHNEVRNFLRKPHRRGSHLSDPLIEKLAETRHADAARIEAQLDRLAECMGRLASEQRKLLEQCYAGAQPIKAIAEEWRLDPSVLYKRLDRIRWTLMDCIQTPDSPGGFSGKEDRS